MRKKIPAERRKRRPPRQPPFQMSDLTPAEWRECIKNFREIRARRKKEAEERGSS